MKARCPRPEPAGSPPYPESLRSGRRDIGDLGFKRRGRWTYACLTILPPTVHPRCTPGERHLRYMPPPAACLPPRPHTGVSRGGVFDTLWKHAAGAVAAAGSGDVRAVMILLIYERCGRTRAESGPAPADPPASSAPPLRTVTAARRRASHPHPGTHAHAL